MIGFLAALGWERHARRQERRRLDEQAERQRLRAPEPGPEEAHLELREEGLTEGDIKLLLVVPVMILAILAVTVNAWIFWIGMLVLCGVVIPIMVAVG